MSEPCYLGFDSQSEIWSPLVPRFHYLTDDDYEDEDDHDFFMAKSKRVFFEELEKHPLEKLKKFTMNVHRKISMGTAKKKKKKKKKENGPGKSPSPVCLPSKKGWSKALRVASRPFKKHKVGTPKRITLAHYLQIEQ